MAVACLDPMYHVNYGTRLKADNPLYGSSRIDYILHAVKMKKNSYKTLITAEYTSFIKMKPSRKVPPDGPVFESNAIARYVSRLKP
ncbi:hypothetical protein CMV_026164 [Castanea mollissima]|uniref:GST N-terminal domain-containing protein n=1 Tax=Castanea mollissima TaxID=60419 RepID=A0A8J4VAP2_9ROSI|nr:hypothetical protein CMV_026164 [Castanea mollissima]